MTNEQVDRLLVHLSFKSMKNNRAVNYEPVIEKIKEYRLIEEDGSFMRCGEVGEWKEVMSPELSAQFEKRDREKLQHLIDTELLFL